MKPDGAGRWERAKEVFAAALEKAPSQRPGFVEEACGGDTPLRDEVETLLAAHDRAGSFLESPPVGGDEAESLLAAGTRVGPYEILCFLSAGGMGRIYRARDTRLDREVAIKFLAPGAHDEKQLQRFEQEARAAGSLDHPNVLVVHDVGTLAGEPYIVTELLQGTTLRERMGRKPLPAGEAVDFTLQLARGLRAAHEKGVVHRDLKPENLFVTSEGRLKILDFGIAKLADTSGRSSPTTAEGALIGTVDYMAPEQVRSQPADARSDIFACGGILYEMLSGKRAFDGKTSMETALAILHQEPSPLPTGVAALDRVVRRCVAKDPADRFQSAGELIAALSGRESPAARGMPRWVLPAVSGATVVALIVLLRPTWTTAERSSIAVMPFANLSGDQKNDYLSDGITEELIDALANVDGMHVASRTSVFALKDKHLDARQIGEKLNVKTLLEGSVRREGNALRVTAQLISVSDDVHLWSHAYDHELKGIFALENEIALSIAQTLRRKLVGGKSVARVATTSQEAHDLYLRGSYLKEKRTGQELFDAAEYFRQATERDPNYALAWAGLAEAFTLLIGYGQSPALPEAKRAALRALELDPDLAQAHASMGLIAFREYDWPAADRSLRRSIELKPDYPEAHLWYALGLSYRGRLREARLETEQVLRLDWNSLLRHNLVAIMALFNRDLAAAEAGYKRVLEMDHGFVIAHAELASLYVVEERWAEAEAQIDQGPLMAMAPLRGLLYAFSGRSADALRLAETLAREREYASAAGLIWVALGEKERGYALLHEACLRRDASLQGLKVDPLYDKMRSDPQFASLLTCLNLE